MIADPASRPDPRTAADDEDAPAPDGATNQGRSAQAPAEGDDDIPGRDPGSPAG